MARLSTPAEDGQLAADLLADPKERAEHLMLVDLGRNDLGRVCAPGTVEVVEFASSATATSCTSSPPSWVNSPTSAPRSTRWWRRSRAGYRPAALRRSGQWRSSTSWSRPGAGSTAVSSATSASAVQDLDTAIAIRTALIRDGMAYVQAGGGIVADSDPTAEELETRNKAAAVLAAIAAAETLRPAR